MKIAIYTISAALFGTAAFAGGPVVPAPEPVVAPVVSPAPVAKAWQGGYVGGSLVYGEGNVDAAGDLSDLLDFAGLDDTLSEPEGFGGAVRVGYDWQINRTVLGLGASYDFGKYDDSVSVDGFGQIDGTEAEISNIATVFARAGYDAGRWMPYVLAGYSWADAEASADGFGSESVDIDGYTVGLGVNYMITDRWTGFAEYNYTDFGDIEDTEGLLEADLNRLNLGVAYKF